MIYDEKIPKQHLDKVQRLTKKFNKQLQQKYDNPKIHPIGSVVCQDTTYIIAINSETFDAYLYNAKQDKYRKYGSKEMMIIGEQITKYCSYMEQQELLDKGLYQ